MKQNPASREKERLEALQALIEEGRGQVADYVECARLLRRLSWLTQGQESSRTEAQQVLQQGLQKFPDSPELTYELARTKNPYGDRRGDPELLQRAIQLFQARGLFQQAEAAAFDLATDVFQEGCEAREAGDPHKAEDCFRRALAIYPHHADACVHLGMVYEERGDWLEAARWYWRGVQLGRIACHEREIHERRLARGARSPAAVRTPYWGALETRPYLRALSNLARLYFTRSEFELARILAEECLLMNPDDNTGARVIIYSILRCEGKKEQMNVLGKKYGSGDLAARADELERSCFGTLLAGSGTSGKTQ